MSNPGKPFVKGMAKIGGRVKGSRNKICARFIDDLYAEWEASGADALKVMSKEDPSGFVKVTASILPKELEVTQTQIMEIPDDELAALRDLVKRRIDQRRDFIERIGPGAPETIN
jgi:hypothetical protein